jgi:tetratricopeptide (TPR) repeat protein
MSAPSNPIPPKKRLDSWKEIAAFFDRDERTVKRWEKERGLPVHRVPGSARGSVFAYAEELAEWLGAREHAIEPADSPRPRIGGLFEERRKAGPAMEVVGGRAVDKAAEEAAPAAPVGPLRAALRILPPASRMAAIRPFLWLVPLGLIAISFLVFSFGHRSLHFKNALAARQLPDGDAQDLYLKGRYYFERRTPDDLNKAVDFFTQAIVHDPGYAASYVGLADSYNLLREYSVMPPEEAFPRARAAATKAVELDPTSAEAHNSLAFATYWGFFDAAAAEREFQRAIELDPSLARAHHWYATFLVEIGQSKEALAEIERARQLDPSSTPILADKGFILAQAGRREEARALLKQLTVAQPEFVHPHQYLADIIYFREGDYERYFAEEKIVARLRHDADLERMAEQEQRGYESGGLQGMLQSRLSMAQLAFERGSGEAFAVADAHAALGQNDEAWKYLQIASQRHEFSLVTLPIEPDFRPLHQNPKYRDLLAKLGLPFVP